MRLFEKGDIVLALAPHTDDVDLGCGGLLVQAIEAGAVVYEVAFSTAKESLPPGFAPDTLEHEVRRAAKELGLASENVSIRDYPVRHFPAHRQEILEELVALRKRLAPKLVLAPTSSDVHQDHGVVFMETVRAFKGTTILGYELPWNHLSFSPTAVIAMTEGALRRKLAALDCYQSQKHRPYATEEVVRGIAAMRGATIGVRYAEAFELIRLVA